MAIGAYSVQDGIAVEGRIPAGQDWGTCSVHETAEQALAAAARLRAGAAALAAMPPRDPPYVAINQGVTAVYRVIRREPEPPFTITIIEEPS